MSDMFNYSSPQFNYSPDSSLGMTGTGSYWGNLGQYGTSNPSSSSLSSGTNLTGSGGIGSAQNTLGLNIPTMQLGLAGVGALGNLWGAYQSNKLAQNQFNYTKQITDTNLANQIQSYNTSLADRASSRGSMEGWSDEQKQSYIDQNKLSK